MRSMVGLAGIVCPRISGESSENPIGRFAGTSHFHLCVRHAKEARADIKTHAPKGLLIAISGSSVGQGQHEISHQMVAEDALFSLLGHLFRVVTSWSLPCKVRKI